jgi:hypothetical protein
MVTEMSDGKLADDVARQILDRADAEWCRRYPPKLAPATEIQRRRAAFKEGFVAGWLARSLEVPK